MLFIKPLDERLLRETLNNHTHIITVEDGCIKGGFGSAIKEFILDNDFNVKIKSLGIPDEFIDQGPTVKLQEISGIDSKTILKTINEFLA